MKIVVRENQFHRLQEIQEKEQINQILIESLNYMDYVELGIDYIRDWIKKNDIKLPQSKVPLSWIIDNYGKEIVRSITGKEVPHFQLSAERIGKMALDAGLVEDPSIKKEGTFTEKYGPILEKMIGRVLPEYVEFVGIEEPTPWEVTLKFSYDPDIVIKKGKVQELRELKDEIRNSSFFKTLGLNKSSEVAKAHGGIALYFNIYPQYDWFDKVSSTLIKTIKKNTDENNDIIWQIRKNRDLFRWGGDALKIFVYYTVRYSSDKEKYKSWYEKLDRLLMDLGYEFPDDVYNVTTKY